MSAIKVEQNFDETKLEALMLSLGEQGLIAQAAALKVVARKGRTGFVRAMASKLGIPQKPIRARSNFYGKKVDKTRNTARAKIWVGLSKKITARDTPRVLNKFKGKSFVATMPSGYTGTFVRADDWKKAPRNSHRRLTRHYFERADGQNTYLPIEEAALTMEEEGPKLLLSNAKSAVTSAYPKELERALLRRVPKVRRQSRIKGS